MWCCCDPKYNLVDEDEDDINDDPQGLSREKSVDVRSLESVKIHSGEEYWLKVISMIPTAVKKNPSMYNSTFISRDIEGIRINENKYYIRNQCLNIRNLDNKRDVQIDINDLLGRIYFERKDDPIRFN